MSERTHETPGEERLVPMRLQRFLARSGAASRRGAENLMTAGRVKVNGEVVTKLGSKVDPTIDVVTVDDVEVRMAERPCYLVLNKPAGYLTTMRDPYGRPTVATLVPTSRYPGLFPVGRLDQDTTGILLFTTNGRAAQELLHPSRHVSKHYVALVDGVPTTSELRRLEAGIMLDDGPASPCEARLIYPDDTLFRVVAADGVQDNCSVVGITIHEGRKHQVKRMLAAIGHNVRRLHRDTFGPLSLKGLERGQWRLLDDDEVAQIEAIVAAAPPTLGPRRHGRS